MFYRKTVEFNDMKRVILINQPVLSLDPNVVKSAKTSKFDYVLL